MQFHMWQTTVSEYRRIYHKDPRVKALSFAQISHIEEKSILSSVNLTPFQKWNRVIRLEIENVHDSIGSPYYNVHPMMAKKLVNTNLNNIPSEFVESPNDFSVVEFRFAENIPTQYTSQNGVIRFNVVPDASNSVYTRSALFAKIKCPDNEFYRKYNPDDVGNDIFILIPDCGIRVMRPDIDCTLCSVIRFYARAGETIPQAIERILYHEQEEKEYKFILQNNRNYIINLFRCIIACGFLANTPRFILFDCHEKVWVSKMDGSLHLDAEDNPNRLTDDQAFVEVSRNF